jgi:hypothetical protein
MNKDIHKLAYIIIPLVIALLVIISLNSHIFDLSIKNNINEAGVLLGNHKLNTQVQKEIDSSISVKVKGMVNNVISQKTDKNNILYSLIFQTNGESGGSLVTKKEPNKPTEVVLCKEWIFPLPTSIPLEVRRQFALTELLKITQKMNENQLQEFVKKAEKNYNKYGEEMTWAFNVLKTAVNNGELPLKAKS